MTDFVDWGTRFKRFDELRARDRVDEAVFLGALDALTTKAQQELALYYRDVVNVWRAQMEVLIVCEKDKEWLDTLTSEFQESTRRSVASFLKWSVKARCAEHEKLLKHMEKTLRDSSKNYMAGRNTVERLEAHISERQAMMNRWRIDALTQKAAVLEESTTNSKTSIIPIEEMFTRLFRKAIE